MVFNHIVKFKGTINLLLHFPAHIICHWAKYKPINNTSEVPYSPPNERPGDHNLNISVPWRSVETPLLREQTIIHDVFFWSGAQTGKYSKHLNIKYQTSCWPFALIACWSDSLRIQQNTHSWYPARALDTFQKGWNLNEIILVNNFFYIYIGPTFWKALSARGILASAAQNYCTGFFRIQPWGTIQKIPI